MAYLAFAAICLLWGTTFLAIRVAIETMPTLLVSGFRFLGAGLVMLVIALATNARFPRRGSDWLRQSRNGILMFGLGNTLVVYAQHELSSGLAALLAAAIPVWMAVLEAITGTACMTRKKILGLVLGFGGVGVLVLPRIGDAQTSWKFFVAVAAMQLSSIVWNSGTLFSKRQPVDADRTAVGAIQMLAGGLFATLLAGANGSLHTLHFSGRSLIALLYLIVFGSVIAYSCYLYALSKLSAGKLSSYAYVNPAVAVLFGAMFLAEPLSLQMLVAMVIILAGVAVIQIDLPTTRKERA